MMTARDQGRVSLRCPNNQTELEASTSSSACALRCGNTFLPGQGFISGLRWQELTKSMLPWQFWSLDSKSSESSYFLLSLRQTKRQKILQLTGLTSKKQRETKNRVVGCKPESDRVCWKWQIFAETDTIRVLTNENHQQDLVNVILYFYHLHFAFMETSERNKRIREALPFPGASYSLLTNYSSRLGVVGVAGATTAKMVSSVTDREGSFVVCS